MSSPVLRSKVRVDNVQRQLVFAPLAWLKMRFLLHAGETEVGAFGIAAEDHLLYIEDLAVPRQHTTEVSVEFEDTAVADHFDGCFDRGIGPARCGRIWIHSHPGSSPFPSSTDEQTFQRAFGNCDWAVMTIIARGGASYARMRFAVGPGGSVILPVHVDWQRLPQDLLEQEGKLDVLIGAWMDEYGANVHPIPFAFETPPANSVASVPANAAEAKDVLSNASPREYFDEMDRLEELHEEQFVDQEFWGEGFSNYPDEQEMLR
jgi:hypothetical protein